jgi:hypothetical protein
MNPAAASPMIPTEIPTARPAMRPVDGELDEWSAGSVGAEETAGEVSGVVTVPPGAEVGLVGADEVEEVGGEDNEVAGVDVEDEVDVVVADDVEDATKPIVVMAVGDPGTLCEYTSSLCSSTPPNDFYRHT